MIKAFESYNPDRGASLRTHVEGRLQKAKRYNVKNQNFAYIPEEQVRFIGKIQKAHDELSDDYGRAPTNIELATHLNSQDSRYKLTAKRIGEIRANQKADQPGSLWTYDPMAQTSNREQEVLNLINSELPSIFPNADERMVFEHIYGLNGKPTLTGTNELARRLGKSPSQISRIKTSVGAKVKSYL
jgi:DNA-directed RNA polymerase specialized sigma subunit